jgi:molybdate transport system substrate-binding protein
MDRAGALRRLISASSRWLLLFSFLIGPVEAAGADITLISGGAVEPGLRAAVAAFEQQSGHKVQVTYNTAPQIQKRIESGDKFDVILAPPTVVDGFAKAGLASAGGSSVGRVGLGVAVREGAPVPDIGSTEALKRSVLEADRIVFNRASTGIYFEGLLKKLDVWTAVESKTTRYPDGAAVMDHVRNGTGREIAFGAITEILLYRDKGLRFVGPLPAEVQNYTSYIASLTPQGAASQAARELVAFLATPQSRQLFAAAGVD